MKGRKRKDKGGRWGNFDYRLKKTRIKTMRERRERKK